MIKISILWTIDSYDSFLYKNLCALDTNIHLVCSARSYASIQTADMISRNLPLINSNNNNNNNNTKIKNIFYFNFFGILYFYQYKRIGIRKRNTSKNGYLKKGISGKVLFGSHNIAFTYNLRKIGYSPILRFI